MVQSLEIYKQYSALEYYLSFDGLLKMVIILWYRKAVSHGETTVESDGNGGILTLLSVCLSMHGFGRNFVQGQRSVSDCIFVAIVPKGRIRKKWSS